MKNAGKIPRAAYDHMRPGHFELDEQGRPTRWVIDTEPRHDNYGDVGPVAAVVLIMIFLVLIVAAACGMK